VTTETAGATSVPGVWATGNVASPRELVVDAAIAINMDLVLADADAARAGELLTAPT
jgi:thioredoxin reductase